MANVVDVIDNMVPISDFSRGKASQAFEKASNGTPVIVLRNNTPTAVIISPEEYRRLAEAEENLYLLGLALERLEANEGKELIPFETILAEHGITQEELDAIPDEDVEFEYE